MARGVQQDKTKGRFWRRMVHGQARSGLSIRAWCRKHDLREPSFYWWRARLARTDRACKARPRKPMLVPVRATAEGTAGAEGLIEIILSNDRRIRVRGLVDRQLLADVLAVLEMPPC